jgi:hypothetical protein
MGNGLSMTSPLQSFPKRSRRPLPPSRPSKRAMNRFVAALAVSRRGCVDVGRWRGAQRPTEQMPAPSHKSLCLGPRPTVKGGPTPRTPEPTGSAPSSGSVSLESLSAAARGPASAARSNAACSGGGGSCPKAEDVEQDEVPEVVHVVGSPACARVSWATDGRDTGGGEERSRTGRRCRKVLPLTLDHRVGILAKPQVTEKRNRRVTRGAKIQLKLDLLSGN